MTREVMERTVEEAVLLQDEKSIWLCVMCNSCSERCQLGVDPALVITLLRQAAAQVGNRPQHFVDEAKLFQASGLSFPNTGMTRKLRKELGLPIRFLGVGEGAGDLEVFEPGAYARRLLGDDR